MYSSIWLSQKFLGCNTIAVINFVLDEEQTFCFPGILQVKPFVLFWFTVTIWSHLQEKPMMASYCFDAHRNFYKLIYLIIAMLAEAARNKHIEFRTYRVEKNYAVSAGKWYDNSDTIE
jgi:hypothetical protein